MGFLDAIKRWRMAQQGWSSGKKRRVHGSGAIAQSLEYSIWVRHALYLAFAILVSILVLKAVDRQRMQELATGADIETVEDAVEPDMAVHLEAATPTRLEHERLASESSMRIAIYAFAIALSAVVMFHISHDPNCRRNSRVVLVLGGIMVNLFALQLMLHLMRQGTQYTDFRMMLLPYALAPMLHGVLLGRSMATYSTIYVSLLGSLMVSSGDRMVFLIVSLASGFAATVFAGSTRRRIELLRAGLLVGSVVWLLLILLGSIDVSTCIGEASLDCLQHLGLSALLTLGGGVIAVLFISGVLPLFEGAFQLTTHISWMELGDLNHKLLRRMQLEAPGTFHHSLVVASLSEAAAEAIGANAPLCRVCSYFHDVGKLNKPEYFIENQHDGAENPHEGLTPTMSALVILAHVKDGVDLAVKHKLNPRIIDIIQEHHGDSLVYFFYRKAQEQKKAEMEKVEKGLGNVEDLPHVDEKNFRYPGPRPRTRESGIISLADSIESASRSLRKPSPGKIRALVDDMVQARLADGQLDDCPLTMKELAVVKESFASTLRSMLHSRIDYPKDDKSPVTRRASGDPGPQSRLGQAERPGKAATTVRPAKTPDSNVNPT